MKSSFVIILFILLTLACSTRFKKKFDPVNQVEFKQRVKSLQRQHYLDSNQIFVIFYKGFNNSNVKVYENSLIKFDSFVTTPDTYPRMAAAIKINKETELKILSPSFKNPLVINKNDMKNYTSVFISKNGKNAEAHFTDDAKFRTDQWKEDERITKKYKRERIRDSIKNARNPKY